MDADGVAEFCGTFSGDAGIVERDEDVCAGKKHGMLSGADQWAGGGRSDAVVERQDGGIFWGGDVGGVSEPGSADGAAA